MTTDLLEALRIAFQENAGYQKLYEFCRQVDDGEVPDQQILEDLAEAKKKMLAEKSLKKRPAIFRDAMSLRGRKGLKPPTAAEDSPKFEAAVQVFLLDPDGVNQAWAVGQVADVTGLDDSTIRRYVRNNRETAQSTARWIQSIEKNSRWIQSFEKNYRWIKNIEKKRKES